jgi:integrase
LAKSCKKRAGQVKGQVIGQKAKEKMEEMKKSTYYYLCKKKKAKRNYWYAYFPDESDQDKVTIKSVEALRKMLGVTDRTPITRKQEATVITQRAVDAGLIEVDEKDPLFVDYVSNFWDFENSDYIRRKNLKNSGSVAIGPDYAKNIQGTFNKHAEGLFPAKLKLSDVTTAHLEDAINQLIDDGVLSMASIQRVVQAMAVPLKEAAKIKRIPFNPMSAVDPISSKPKERGILTGSEMVSLFTSMQSQVREMKFDNQVYLACLLSSYTGMRQGEIRALRSDVINLVNDQHGIIVVNKAFANFAGYKTPKGKRDRQVPVPRGLCDDLLANALVNPYQNNLVFWSKTSKVNPISASYIRDHLYESLADLFEKEENRVGVMVQDGNKVDKDGNPIKIRAGEETRRKRNVNFHSFRHFFVTQMRGRLSEGELQSVVGHQSTAMLAIYTHETEAGLLRIGTIADNIIPFPNEGNHKDSNQEEGNEV